jgi:hypothetical protein
MLWKGNWTDCPASCLAQYLIHGRAFVGGGVQAITWRQRRPIFSVVFLFWQFWETRSLFPSTAETYSRWPKKVEGYSLYWSDGVYYFYKDNLHRSLPSVRCAVFYYPGDTYLSLDVANTWNRTWDSDETVYKTNLNYVSAFWSKFHEAQAA